MIEHRCSKSVATDCYSRRLIDYFRKKMNENVCNRIYNIYFCFPNQNTIYMNDDRVCRECGDVLQGRADKKFCDDQCRSNYNNKANNNDIAEVRSINSILRRNRRILGAAISSESSVKIPKGRLQEQGFNFRYYTHTHTTQKGNIYKLCYDYAYLPLENDFVRVVKWGRD